MQASKSVVEFLHRGGIRDPFKRRSRVGGKLGVLQERHQGGDGGFVADKGELLARARLIGNGRVGALNQPDEAGCVVGCGGARGSGGSGGGGGHLDAEPRQRNGEPSRGSKGGKKRVHVRWRVGRSVRAVVFKRARVRAGPGHAYDWPRRPQRRSRARDRISGAARRSTRWPTRGRRDARFA